MEHRLDHPLRNRGQRDRPPLLALAAERREHRRVERQALARTRGELELQHAIGRTRRRRPPRGAAHVRSRRPLKDDADRLALELRSARQNRDASLAEGEFARLLQLRPLCVSKIIESIDQLSIGQRLAAAQLERPREHARKHRVALAVQPRVDQAREADVVVAGDEPQNDERNRSGERGVPHPALPPENPDEKNEALNPCSIS